MRVLIDEGLNWRLARGLPGHQVSSVTRMGWQGIKNGRLLALAATQFDVLITGDRNLEFQQNVSRLPIAVIVLKAPGIRLRNIMPLMPEVLRRLASVSPGSVTEVG